MRRFLFGMLLGFLSVLNSSHAHAQVFGAGLGYTISNMQWANTNSAPVTGDRSRRTMSIAGSYGRQLRKGLWGETGLRLVGRGFDGGLHVPSSTIHMFYLEAPLLGVVRSDTGFSPFLSFGATIGLRITCHRSINNAPVEVHADGCGDSEFSKSLLAGLRRWDVSGEVATGLRIPVPEEGVYVFTVRFQRGLPDLQPKAAGRMSNHAVSISVALQWEP